MQEEQKKKTQDKMQAAMDALKKDFGAIRTGRASLTLLEGILVDYYNTPTPLEQVATLSLPDSRLIAIQPWETSIISNIERAILKSDLDLTPNNDGKIIRINIPPLTEERRKQLVKIVKKRAEEAKVSVRNLRRELNEKLKGLEKDKEISEDDLKKSLDDSQKLTDQFVKKVDDILSHKETEIMEV